MEEEELIKQILLLYRFRLRGFLFVPGCLFPFRHPSSSLLRVLILFGRLRIFYWRFRILQLSLFPSYPRLTLLLTCLFRPLGTQMHLLDMCNPVRIFAKFTHSFSILLLNFRWTLFYNRTLFFRCAICPHLTTSFSKFLAIFLRNCVTKHAF